MSSVNWIGIYKNCVGLRSFEELKKVLVKNGVEEGRVMEVICSGMRHYGYGRDYRENRNNSVKEVRSENKRMKELVEKYEKELGLKK